MRTWPSKHVQQGQRHGHVPKRTRQRRAQRRAVVEKRKRDAEGRREDAQGTRGGEARERNEARNAKWAWIVCITMLLGSSRLRAGHFSSGNPQCTTVETTDAACALSFSSQRTYACGCRSHRSTQKRNCKCIRLNCSNRETIFVERSAFK